MAAQNPFESLVTPDDLQSARLAEASAKYADQPIYTQMAAEAGARTNNALTNAGMLTPADIKAQHTNKVMQTAQSKYADYIKDGSMTPDDAQAKVLEDAIREFSGAGNWEQAIALTQPLNALKTQAAERAKLKADTAFLESKPEAKALDQQIAQLKIDADFQAKMNALEIARERAYSAADRMAQQNVLTQTQADYLNYKMTHPELFGSGGRGVSQTVIHKETKALNEQVTNAADSANLMADLREQILANPQAATATGDIVTKITRFGSAAKAAVNSSGWDANRIKGDDGRPGENVSQWLKNNIANEKQRALVVSLAYAFARTNDPGGRLSNQDLEQAKVVVAGEGSPEARIELIDQAFTQLARRTTNAISSNVDNQITLGKNTFNLWQGVTNRYASAAAKHEAALRLKEKQLTGGAGASSSGLPPGVTVTRH